MECGKNLVDIVLQKRAASPPQSLPYTVRKAIEQTGTVTSTERVESHAAMNICAATVSIVMLILALPNKGRSTDLLRQ
ncbi:hypothetical protein T12_8106, partial [Trichinella patagoniensis]